MKARFRYSDAVPALAAIVVGRPAPDDVAPARLVEAATYHRLGAVLVAAARDGRAELPPPLRGELERHEWGLVQRSALHLAELPALVQAVEHAAGAPPIVLKGPDAASLWPSRALRAFGDLDLLVPRPALDAAGDALCALGYEPLVELRPGFGGEHGHDLHLVRRTDAGDLHVELHWRVGDDPCADALDHARMLPEALPLEGVPQALRPGASDRLLVFAVHFLSDRKRRLTWANDVRLAALAASSSEWGAAFARTDALPWVLDRALGHVETAFGPVRPRPRPCGPPPFGPIRAIEASGAPVALHVGRLARLGWRERVRYVHHVALPTRAGLEGTVGGDGAPVWRLALRHARQAARSLLPRR